MIVFICVILPCFSFLFGDRVIITRNLFYNRLSGEYDRAVGDMAKGLDRSRPHPIRCCTLKTENSGRPVWKLPESRDILSFKRRKI